MDWWKWVIEEMDRLEHLPRPLFDESLDSLISTSSDFDCGKSVRGILGGERAGLGGAGPRLGGRGRVWLGPPVSLGSSRPLGIGGDLLGFWGAFVSLSTGGSGGGSVGIGGSDMRLCSGTGLGLLLDSLGGYRHKHSISVNSIIS